MLKLIKRLFKRNKAKKIIIFLDNLDIAFTLFKEINNDEEKFKKIINSLSKGELYPDVISRYNVYLNKIKNHNAEVKSLIFAYNSLMSNYSIEYIINNILDFNYEKLKEIYGTIKSVYSYVIPNSFEKKAEYDNYKLRFEKIIRDYKIINEQKRIIISIDNEIKNLPDIYIDEDSIPIVLSNALTLIEKYKGYEYKYFKNPIITDSMIESHNESFIERHINDSIFDNVNGRSLDNEQRRAILCDSKSNLIIAGAGSGKTLTICGKVKYLLETGRAKNNEILLLSYSSESAKDLQKKVLNVATGLTIQTFHALGLKIITENSGKKKTIEEQLKSYIMQFFKEELYNYPILANEIFQYISLYFYAAPTYKKKYKNDGDLFKDLKTAEFTTLKDRMSKLSADKDKHETLKHEYVKSNEELVIANYLFTNGINYEYEKPYKFDTSTIDKRQYTPDFYLTDYDIYLEHYGIDRNGNAPQYYETESEKYIRSMKWKREIHSENETVCVETYSYEFNEGVLFDNLNAKLLEHGVKFNPLSQIEVFNALHNVYDGRDFSSFFNLITTFISLYKAQIKNDIGFDRLKESLKDSLYDTTRTRLFLDICKDIYNFYMQNLRKANKIDFDDMILQSIDLLDFSQNFKYKYIIVDEFQDISQSRTKLLQKLIEHGNSKLFAVGDDWQAIYRFAGCDINVFLEFSNIFSGAKLNYITSTHRNSIELQKIVEPFITANPSQYKKNIKSNIHQDKPVRIIYHKGNKAMALTKALADIFKINFNAKVLILGRNRHDIDSCICNEIKIFNKTIKHKDFPTLNLSYSTIHGSKGLESDFVILISGEDAQNGFPNKTEDDRILTLLLGKKNSYEYAEERRLFYVALTRTKSIVYLLANKNNTSEFIKEINNKCYIIGDESEEKNEEEYLCPWCKSGHLTIRTSEVDGKNFYGCSNFPYCLYTNNNLKGVYLNKRCPVCGDFLVLRKGKYGTFFGCHNYPRCSYTEKMDNHSN